MLFRSLSGEADVLVCEGYAGNVFLKASEGVAKMMGQLINDAFRSNVFSMIGYVFAQGGFKRIKEVMNYKAFGGAMLFGINGVVVKAHGNSDAYSFEHSGIDGIDMETGEYTGEYIDIAGYGVKIIKIKK